jgi:hypothetical protein
MVNQTVEYDIDIANEGPREAYHLVISGTIPDPAELIAASGTDWTCSVDGNQFSCYLPYLAVDGTEAISFSLRSAIPSPLSFEVTISQANNDPDPENSQLTIATTIVIQTMLPLINK